MKYANLGLTENSTADQIFAALSKRYPQSLVVSGVTASLAASLYEEKENLAYTSTFDITSFKTLRVEGSFRTGLIGQPDPAYCTIYLQTSAGSNVLTIDTASGGNVNRQVNKTINVASYRGTYRIAAYVKCENDGATCTISRVTLEA